MSQRDSEPGESGSEALQAALRGMDLLVVLGGDGTIRGASLAAVQAGVPVYLMPHGTENLLARHYGFTRGIDQLVRSLLVRRVGMMDVCEANGQRFLIMAGIGFDAAVVADLAARRAGGISKFSYALPILRTAWTWRGQVFTITCDGDSPRRVGPGTLVVANLPVYAARLDPVPGALANDGRLDGAVLNARTALGVMAAAFSCWLRIPTARRGSTTWSGTAITISSALPFRFQVDGDRPAGLGMVHELAIRVVEGQLGVWLPARLDGK